MGVKPFADNFFWQIFVADKCLQIIFQSQLFWQLIVVDYILEILQIIMHTNCWQILQIVATDLVLS